MPSSATKGIQAIQAVSNLPISAWVLAVIWLPRGKTEGSQALIGRFETACIPLVAEFGTDHIEKAVFVTSASIFYVQYFCVNSSLKWRRSRLTAAKLQALSPSYVLTRLKVGVNVKAVFTSLNTAFLPISRSRFKRRQIPMLITLSTIWQFCVHFWVIFRCFGKERFFLKG